MNLEGKFIQTITGLLLLELASKHLSEGQPGLEGKIND